MIYVQSLQQYAALGKKMCIFALAGRENISHPGSWKKYCDVYPKNCKKAALHFQYTHSNKQHQHHAESGN